MNTARPQDHPVYAACLEAAKKPLTDAEKSEIEALTQQAWELYHRGDFSQAIIKAKQAAYRGNIEALNIFAISQYCKFKNKDMLATRLEFLVEQDLAHPLTYFCLGQHYISEENKDKAKAAYYFRIYLAKPIKHHHSKYHISISFFRETLECVNDTDPQALVIIFNTALALKNRQKFNEISHHPEFIKLVIKENWEEIASLLSLENAQRVYNIIAKQMRQEREATMDSTPMPAALTEIILSYAVNMHPCYSHYSFVPDPLLYQFKRAYKPREHKNQNELSDLTYYGNELFDLAQTTDDLDTLDYIIIWRHNNLSPDERHTIQAKAAKLGSIVGLRYMADAKNFNNSCLGFEPTDPLIKAKKIQYCEATYALGDFYAAAQLGYLYLKSALMLRHFKTNHLQQARIYFCEAFKRQPKTKTHWTFAHEIYTSIETVFKLVRSNPNNENTFDYCFHLLRAYSNQDDSYTAQRVRQLRKLNRQLYWKLDGEQNFQKVPTPSATTPARLFAIPSTPDAKADTDLGEKNNLIRYITLCLNYKDLTIPKRKNLESVQVVLSKLDTRNKKIVFSQFEKIRRAVADILDNTSLSSELRQAGINLSVPFRNIPAARNCQPRHGMI